MYTFKYLNLHLHTHRLTYKHKCVKKPNRIQAGFFKMGVGPKKSCKNLSLIGILSSISCLKNMPWIFYVILKIYWKNLIKKNAMNTIYWIKNTKCACYNLKIKLI